MSFLQGYINTPPEKRPILFVDGKLVKYVRMVINYHHLAFNGRSIPDEYAIVWFENRRQEQASVFGKMSIGCRPSGREIVELTTDPALGDLATKRP